jgi:hypothetical protein
MKALGPELLVSNGREIDLLVRSFVVRRGDEHVCLLDGGAVLAVAGMGNGEYQLILSCSVHAARKGLLLHGDPELAGANLLHRPLKDIDPDRAAILGMARWAILPADLSTQRDAG